LYFASQGARVAWAVPTYKNGRPLWRWAENTVAPLRKRGQAEVNRSERVIQFSSGGFLGIYSMDSEDSIRGEAFHLVIVDEAARIPEAAWTDAIQPTLADYGGRAILISTPNGKNWFWKEWLRGQTPNERIKSWQAPTRDNPNPRIQRAADMAQERVPERTYQQEWLAQFVEDGSVFRMVNERATATPQTHAIAGHSYAMGCDWGKTHDFTVLTIIDMTTKELVLMDRFNQVDYAVQVGRLQALYDRFTPVVIMAEQNSIGTPIIEQLWRMDLPVQPFVTTNATKARIIEDLLLAFEQGTIQILNDPILIGELQSFAVGKTSLGLPQYSAPSGMFDDCVMSLALCWSAAHELEYVR
jgi:phage terminase large subunit-like protein